MKKNLVIWSLIAASTLLAGCTLLSDKPIRNTSSMMSWNSMTHNMDNMNNMWCCSQSWGNMEDGMMMHNVKNEEEFIVNMIPHHQEAVDTARIIAANSTNNELKQLANAIIEAQTKEINMMQWWLKEWYPNTTVESNYQNMMPELGNLKGSALDSAFLKWMIMHHMGAIHMAQSVLQVQHRAETMTLANNIISTQTQEIGSMRSMLQKIQ